MSKPAHIAEREEIVQKYVKVLRTEPTLPGWTSVPKAVRLVMHAVAADVQLATYKRLGHTMPKLEVTDDGDIVEVENASNL